MEDALRDLTAAERTALELIETFRFARNEGFVRLDLHLARMTLSAQALGWTFRREAALAALDEIGGSAPLRVRLALRHNGALKMSTAPLEPNPPVWTFVISDNRLDPSNLWLRHKTSHRTLYDDTRAARPRGVDEVLFLNRSGALCEGTITNLFLRWGGVLLTPTARAGLLCGVLREHLLATGEAQEATLELGDLKAAEAIYFGNSLRGLIPARIFSGTIDSGKWP